MQQSEYLRELRRNAELDDAVVRFAKRVEDRDFLIKMFEGLDTHWHDYSGCVHFPFMIDEKDGHWEAIGPVQNRVDYRRAAAKLRQQSEVGLTVTKCFRDRTVKKNDAGFVDVYLGEEMLVWFWIEDHPNFIEAGVIMP